jgi:hypothetical protein
MLMVPMLSWPGWARPKPIRSARLLWGDEGPVQLVIGALLDPGFQNGFLGWLEDFVGFWRRHDLVWTLVEKALDQRAFIGFAGCYCTCLDGIVPAV